MGQDHSRDGLEGARIVVTGGCGFIGSHLVRRLVSLGASRVVVVDSLRYGRQDNLGEERDVPVLEHTLGSDPTDRLATVLSESDYLLHLAAEKHNQSKDDPDAVIGANVVGTRELFSVARDSGVSRIVFASSLYAYGRMSGEDMREDMLPEPRTLYGITKLTGEHLLGLHCHEKMTGVSLRYFFVYGPRQFSGQGCKSVIVKNFERIERGEPPVVYGDGEQNLDYVFVDDVVEATLRALTVESSPPVINVASGVACTINSLTAAMLKVAGSDLRPERRRADWTAGSRRVGDTSLAKASLGWGASTSLEEGLSRTLAWIRSAPA